MLYICHLKGNQELNSWVGVHKVCLPLYKSMTSQLLLLVLPSTLFDRF